MYSNFVFLNNRLIIHTPYFILQFNEGLTLKYLYTKAPATDVVAPPSFGGKVHKCLFAGTHCMCLHSAYTVYNFRT